MEFLQFVKDEALILIPVLLIIGKMIKISKLVSSRFIPLILLGISLIFSTAIFGFSYQSAIQGVLIAGTAVFGHQLYKQSKVEE